MGRELREHGSGEGGGSGSRGMRTALRNDMGSDKAGRDARRTWGMWASQAVEGYGRSIMEYTLWAPSVLVRRKGAPGSRGNGRVGSGGCRAMVGVGIERGFCVGVWLLRSSVGSRGQVSRAT